MNVNKIIITGNLTADPELRYTPSGKAVLSASIANNEHFTDAQGQEQKVTTFVNLEVWGRPAENFGKLVKKGQELFVDGRLRMDEWTDKQTNARRTRLLSPGRELAIHAIQAPGGERSRCSRSRCCHLYSACRLAKLPDREAFWMLFNQCISPTTTYRIEAHNLQLQPNLFKA